MSAVESFQVHNGQRLLLSNGTRSAIVHRWFGMKSAKSKKATWNDTLLASGPSSWVAKEWGTMKANYQA